MKILSHEMIYFFALYAKTGQKQHLLNRISVSDNVLEGVFVGVHSFSKPRGKKFVKENEKIRKARWITI